MFPALYVCRKSARTSDNLLCSDSPGRYTFFSAAVLITVTFYHFIIALKYCICSEQSTLFVLCTVVIQEINQFLMKFRICAVLCTIVVNANVLMRYFLKRPLYWSEEVATGLFVWTVFIGSAYAYRKHAHLGVDILINILPEKIRKVVKVIMDLLELVTLIMLTRTSVQYVMNTMDKLTNTLRVPSWYISGAVPIGFGLSLIFCIYFLVKDIIKVFKGKGGNN